MRRSGGRGDRELDENVTVRRGDISVAAQTYHIMSHTSLSLREYTTGTTTPEAVAFLVMRPSTTAHAPKTRKTSFFLK